MGKRKRQESADSLPCSLADSMPCSSAKKLLFKETSSHMVSYGDRKHEAENSGSRLELTSSLGYQHQNLSRPFFLKKSRHHYGHQYSRRNLGYHGIASSSYSPSEERTFAKLLKRSRPTFSHYQRNFDVITNKAERIKYSFLKVDQASLDSMKMHCAICEKVTGSVYEVVAVLTCGHSYHADCLESKTERADKHDPPCPLCANHEGSR